MAQNMKVPVAPIKVSPTGWCGPTLIAVGFYFLGITLEVVSAVVSLFRGQAMSFGTFVGSVLFYSIISIFWISLYYFLCANGLAWLSWTILIIKLFLMTILVIIGLFIFSAISSRKNKIISDHQKKLVGSNPQLVREEKEEKQARVDLYGSVAHSRLEENFALLKSNMIRRPTDKELDLQNNYQQIVDSNLTNSLENMKGGNDKLSFY